jgi:cytochrome c-type biogenesis protein CcmH/NrfG
MLGEVEFQSGNTTGAASAFGQAVKLQPKSFSAHYRLAVGFLRNKDGRRSNHPDLAAEETEKAISLDPNLAEAYYQLVHAYNRLGEKEKSARAAAIFAKLKREDISDKEKFYEGVKKELGLP